MTNHIAQEWESYRRRVLPPDASDVQVVECRRAFYAGAWGLLTRAMRFLSEGLEPRPEDIQLIQDIATELRVYGASGGRG